MIIYFAKGFLLLQTFLLFVFSQFGTSQNISGGFLTISKPIRDGQVLVSKGETFAFGFSRPGVSTNRYVGIWYTRAEDKPMLWVANRDNPINDTSGVLSIDVHGNLVLHVKDRNQPIWSTNITSKSSNNSTVAQLLDSGNLQLVLNETGEVLWQSFDYPTDTFFTHLKLGLDRTTGLNRILRSWKSKDDPGTGNCLYMLSTNSSPESYLYKSNILWWRSGHYNGFRWSGIPGYIQANWLLKISLVNNQTETTLSWIDLPPRAFSRFVVTESGSIEHYTMSEGDKNYVYEGSAPLLSLCDYYGKCGTFGKCQLQNDTPFECTCLPGFQPKSPSEWSLRNTSGGCVRKRGPESICKSGDGFVKVESVKLPDSSFAQLDKKLSLKECRQQCLQNCTCTAYAGMDTQEQVGCLRWYGDLIDTSVLIGGQNLYVRVDALELAHSNGFFANKKRQAIMIVALLVTPLLIFLCAYWLIRRKRKDSQNNSHQSFLGGEFCPNVWEKCYFNTFVARERQLKVFNNVTASSTTFQASQKLDEGRRKPDLLIFDISIILAATDNFSPTKRLGQGGFGPVYKGQLANGQEIAIKTLSRSSRQGTEEFKNEVMLIAKLQHRNLVRLFGCCIHKEEKMLIYEYMPNKSLDLFIFDEINRKIMDWRKRFEIISGIARGVLYLHQDSREKIIHRDLKASNVLLDATMKPKISDFGLVRLFGDDQIEANTNRVVGTYGYMSPEYAMEGLYSIKSDVFSFGVLTLEIISGKRNNHYLVGSPYLNLIGHVWDLWMEGKALDIVDSSLAQVYSAREVLRCIQIGLLCVQEQAADRPTMAEIVFMLGNETTLPHPSKPAFINRRTINYGQDSLSSTGAPTSLNDVTISVLKAR
ncbi:G-type lectin S-receptor-like serine/threonine-protein kinase RKS1 isoform X2 [Quercus robur]|uniref:G-type lectin S-receptor-like serine/threonine-protein kinase RKS1 isoform X2 n=1 Tax=Quercus robur TaxID=38942 RepID=UPI002163EC06|nr:G-type lectin S-receptor-like serine/threonine-protein kinase RKS1 isoform X2 [Quercus robur]